MLKYGSTPPPPPPGSGIMLNINILTFGGSIAGTGPQSGIFEVSTMSHSAEQVSYKR